MNLTDTEINSVKKVARDLLNTLKSEKLVLDWKKRENTRAVVQVTIRDLLDIGLPPKYEKSVYENKCQNVYDHVYDNYLGEGISVYSDK